jgi:hypothetical protein
VSLTWAVVLLAVSASAPALSAQERSEATFPHREHRGLFPLCSTCHSGIETGQTADRYPDPVQCASCHDGQREDRVSWTGPTDTPSNLRFDHVEHARETLGEDAAITCQNCHQDSEEPVFRMAVAGARPEACIGCHAHEAPEHLSDRSDCLSCHVPLPRATGLSVEAIAGFPQPATHDRTDFVLEHKLATLESGGSCAVCHVRESCELCHFNGSEIETIDALERDARVARLVADWQPQYPEPSSHATSEWAWSHGEEALSLESGCANCHTRPSCESCHQSGGEAAVRDLPVLAEGDVRGVSLATGVLRVHAAGFSTQHGAAAASMESTCTGCHAERFCVSCHDESRAPSFHVGNFLQSHAAEGYGNEFECATCHNTEVFCRGCHSDVGMTGNKVGTAFHSSRPFWLLGHGTAARQGLESCVSCHRQSDCMQCHAAVGAWRINPHGTDFDAEALRDKNVTTCSLCHRTGIPPS